MGTQFPKHLPWEELMNSNLPSGYTKLADNNEIIELDIGSDWIINTILFQSLLNYFK